MRKGFGGDGMIGEDGVDERLGVGDGEGERLKRIVPDEEVPWRLEGYVLLRCAVLGRYVDDDVVERDSGGAYFEGLSMGRRSCF